MNKETSLLEIYFNDCKKGEKGVMPYNGEKKITFVWTNKKGWGRIVKLSLSKEGIEEAKRLYEQIDKKNREIRKVKADD